MDIQIVIAVVGFVLALTIIVVTVRHVLPRKVTRKRSSQQSKDSAPFEEHQFGSNSGAARGNNQGRWFGGGPKRSPVPQNDRVAAAAASPKSATKNSTFRILVSLTTPAEIDGAIARRAAETGTVPTRPVELADDVSRGDVLDVVLSGSVLPAPQCTRTRWSGKEIELAFHVHVSESFAESSVLLDVTILSNGIALGVIPLEIAIEPSATAQQTQVGLLTTPKRIFVSYSSVDRRIALDIARAYRRLGIDTFMDRLSLEGGDLWEERLAKEIDRCDAVYLLWSEASAKSKYVCWEISRALGLRLTNPRRLPQIFTHIVGPPPPAEAPKELMALQFNDPAYAVWEQELANARAEEAARGN